MNPWISRACAENPSKFEIDGDPCEKVNPLIETPKVAQALGCIYYDFNIPEQTHLSELLGWQDLPQILNSIFLEKPIKLSICPCQPLIPIPPCKLAKSIQSRRVVLLLACRGQGQKYLVQTKVKFCFQDKRGLK